MRKNALDSTAKVFGGRATCSIKIECHKIDAIIDTGSPVKMITEGCYTRCFRHHKFKESRFIRLMAANGIKIPYIRYLVGAFMLISS